jgi:Ca2+-binding EF-hand superfamily protein
MQKRILIAATAVLLSLPLALNAADENKKKEKGGAFATADADHDGKVSKTEYVTAMTGKLEKAAAETKFADLDKDKDGFLSQQEFNAGAGEKKGGKKKKDN